MSEVVSIEPSQSRVLRGIEKIRITGNAHRQQKKSTGFFSRKELDTILQVYSRQVMVGEWLDYAINHDDRAAVFNIYGQVSATPAFQVYKLAKSYKKQGRYQLTDRHRILKTAKTLDEVLKLIDRPKPRLVHND
jgi:Protein of unknown function (DUF2794)